MEHVRISDDNGKTWRELPNNENSQKYAEKLSFAANVLFEFPNGLGWELECGRIVREFQVGGAS